MTFEVAKDPADEAVCLVRSRNLQGAEVGHEDVRVPRGRPGEREVVVTHELPTSDTPITGEVLRCQVLRPGQPLPTHGPSASPTG